MDRKFPKEVEDAYVAEVLRRGLPAWAAVAAERGTERWRAYRWLHRAGHRVPRAKLPLDESAFDEPMTEEKAYWLGFLMADGHVALDPTRETAITISQSSTAHGEDGKDGEFMIRAFSSFLKSDHKISFRTTSDGYKIVGTQVRSNRLAAALSSIGLFPGSGGRDGIPETMPKDLERHFWRGYIDGDGSPGLNRNTPKIEVVGAVMILQQLRDFAGVGEVPTRMHHGTGQICFYGQRAMELGLRVYSDSSISMPSKKAIVLGWRGLKTKRPRRLASPGPEEALGSDPQR